MRTRFVLALALALLPAPAAHAAPVATHAERLLGLLEESLEPLLRPLAPGDSLLVEPPRAKPKLAGAIGDILVARGYTVATAGPAPRLVVEECRAAVDFPRAHLDLVDLQGRRLLRRASVALVASVEGEDGPLSRVDRRLEASDWLDESRLGELGEDLPAWATVEAPKPGVPGGSRSGWWERGLVAGLLAGVAIVYFSGTQ